MTRLKHVARDVRHALADAAQADDAERQFATVGASCPATGNSTARHGCRGRRRRHCGSTPAPARAHGWRPRRRRSRANWRPTRPAFSQAPVSTVSKPAPMRLTMPSSGSAATTCSRDRRVLEQDAAAALARCDHLFLGPALRDDNLEARGIEHRALEVHIGIIVVGVEDFRHRKDKDGQMRDPEASARVQGGIAAGQVA